jgi:adenylate cyclase class IV
LKARDSDPERSLAACLAIGAEPRGLLVQRDTYFRTRHGRLKLREEEGARAHLIAYERPDRSGQRESRYRIVTVEKADEIKAALAIALGVGAVVAKERRLFLWEGVRIHLDRVDRLGHFVEFEAPAGDGGADAIAATARVESLCRALEVDGDALVAGSYSDLALALPGGEAVERA